MDKRKNPEEKSANVVFCLFVGLSVKFLNLHPIIFTEYEIDILFIDILLLMHYFFPISLCLKYSLKNEF